MRTTEPVPPSRDVQQSPESSLSATEPAPSFQNKLQSAMVSLVGQLKSTYTYGENGTSRMHFSTVESKGLEKSYINKRTNKPLRGDALKRAILEDFRKELEKCTSERGLESCYSKFKDTPEYKILETHQRPQTFKFKESKTSAIQALERMCSDARQLLNPQAALKNEAEPTSHESMGLKK